MYTNILVLQLSAWTFKHIDFQLRGLVLHLNTSKSETQSKILNLLFPSACPYETGQMVSNTLITGL